MRLVLTITAFRLTESVTPYCVLLVVLATLSYALQKWIYIFIKTLAGCELGSWTQMKSNVRNYLLDHVLFINLTITGTVMNIDCEVIHGSTVIARRHGLPHSPPVSSVVSRLSYEQHHFSHPPSLIPSILKGWGWPFRTPCKFACTNLCKA